ncbi:PREDICTED: interferon-inducible double-stranded RNA-dependent protein kinase activator A homolog [Atta cephalotes]|uniref:DRBM domain-containing protein n=1 Tax=Atta cephalotes TaxID=12957 RepID=A0A158P2F5_ATTCE|nr:PREDICTED: interferon-inducible double-stranded RNA-dependent protein kinase activator A homolog [Atta cephalotes]
MSKTPVSILQEMMVKQGMIPDYELIHDGGGRHVNTFTYRVTCDSLSATGTGRCKKDAKHEAAKAMLTEIAAHRNYPQLPAANTPTVSPPKSPFHSAPLPPKIANIPFVNAVGELQELCAENNLHEPKYILIQDIGPPHAKIFTIRCKMSNFEEDGIATTKKQAKHDAAKRMVDKIKSLMNKSKNKEDSSNSSITTIDTDTMNKNAEERYRTLIKSRKINLGLKLADYHTYWRDSLETDKRDKILQQLECVFPNEMIDIDYIIEDDIMEKISQLETILSEIDITINMNDITSDKYYVKSIQLNTCPLLTQFGMGRNNLEASWEALSRIIQSIKLLLS